jgi:hypothetical protein
VLGYDGLLFVAASFVCGVGTEVKLLRPVFIKYRITESAGSSLRVDKVETGWAFNLTRRFVFNAKVGTMPTEV